MTLLESALDAVAYGFSVFPCMPCDKIPCGELVFHGVKDATRDPAQVFKWWSLKPTCNIGVCDGTIVDCDSGLTNLQEARNFGLLNRFPPTLTIRTGRRDAFGVQFHFTGQSVSGLYRANNVTGEVRSGNLYGLWAGSVHPISGARYEIAIDLPRAVVPENILADKRTDGTGRGKTVHGGEEYEALDIESARERYGTLLFRAAHAVRGSRHHNANNVCYYAARLLLAGGFEEQRVGDVVVFPALGERDIKTAIYHAVRSLYARGERNLERMLRDSWESGLKAGRLALTLYNEDFRVLQSLADDLVFQRAWDGNCSDFNGAIETRAYMARVLTAAGCTDVDRVLKSSRIDPLVEFQLAFEGKLHA
jgi:hypothetical protein